MFFRACLLLLCCLTQVQAGQHFAEVSGGMTLQRYSETNKQSRRFDIDSATILTRFDYHQRNEADRWKFWGFAGIDGLALEKEIFLTTVNTAGGVAYRVTKKDEGRTLTVGLGPLLKHTFLATDNLGYDMLMGPQLAIWFQHYSKTGLYGPSVYLKFAVLLVGTSLDPMKSRELVLGARQYSVFKVLSKDFFLAFEYSPVNMMTKERSAIDSQGISVLLGTLL